MFKKIFSKSKTSTKRWNQDELEGRVQRDRPRFRVLIIGKANAGKTTILQKMCETTEAAIVCNSVGRRVRISITDSGLS